ncbi:ABC transporter permease [Bradyrhizobium hereditatis]|uniref:ABC transporter permease n=1 Tax=Bradyrhizobium hereditatis TaxID=2821405 RepID=UPI001CE3A401|nr:hypothetical protein [Bradyrhizobium hereditatis]
MPGALPFIIAGLCVSLSVALVLLVAAELAGTAFGVGYLIQMSQQVFRVDQMFVGLIVLGAMGFAADLLFERTVRQLLPWYGAETAAKRGGQVERRPACERSRAKQFIAGRNASTGLKVEQ